MAADTVEQVRQEIAAERAQRVANGVCACGCGSVLPPSPPRRKNRVYAVEHDAGIRNHREVAYRDRIERLATARGVALRTTASTLDSGYPTTNRRTTGPEAPAALTGPSERPSRNRPRRPDRRVALGKAVDVLAETLAGPLTNGGMEPGRVRAAIEHALADALPPSQRGGSS